MLFMLLAATADPAPPVGSASARASIRILQPARATAKQWRAAPRRSDRLIVDEQGRRQRLRTIDFE